MSHKTEARHLIDGASSGAERLKHVKDGELGLEVLSAFWIIVAIVAVSGLIWVVLDVLATGHL